MKLVTLARSIATFSLLTALIAAPTAHAQYAGHALAFNGIDDFVSVKNTGEFNLGSAFTLEAWVKPTSLIATGDYGAVISGALSDAPVSGLAWSLFLDDGDPSQWGLTVSTPLTNNSNSGPGGLEVGVWQHLATTYDGTTMRIYLNGSLVASKAHPNPGPSSKPSYILLGRWIRSFRGYIDEVRIWNKVRTGRAIDASYQCSLSGEEDGLVGYWRFDEGSGQVAHDSAGADDPGRLGSSNAVDNKDPTWVVSDAPISCLSGVGDRFSRGDANQDSERNLTDAITVLDYLFGGKVKTFTCLDAADFNDDGVLNVTDPISLLDLLFTGKIGALPAPFPGCGYDFTKDRLGCESFDGCLITRPRAE